MTYEDLVNRAHARLRDGECPPTVTNGRITLDRLTYRTWARRAKLRQSRRFCRRRPAALAFLPTSLMPPTRLNQRGELLLEQLEWHDRVRVAVGLQMEMEFINRMMQKMATASVPVYHFVGQDGIYANGERISAPIAQPDLPGFETIHSPRRARWLWRLPWWRRALRWLFAPPPDMETTK